MVRMYPFLVLKKDLSERFGLVPKVLQMWTRRPAGSGSVRGRTGWPGSRFTGREGLTEPRTASCPAHSPALSQSLESSCGGHWLRGSSPLVPSPGERAAPSELGQVGGPGNTVLPPFGATPRAIKALTGAEEPGGRRWPRAKMLSGDAEPSRESPSSRSPGRPRSPSKK